MNQRSQRIGRVLLGVLALQPLALAQESEAPNEAPTASGEVASKTLSFDELDTDLRRQLQEALTELADLRAQMAEEQLPLSRELSRLESDLTAARQESLDSSRRLDSRVFDLSKLQKDIQARKDETTYLSNLLGDYIREFESRLHICELPRYESLLEAAKLAPENENLTPAEKFEAQAAALSASIDRLDEARGGARFEGEAVGEKGLVQQGLFVLIGPSALFRSNDGKSVGTVEQRLGSLRPTLVPFAKPEDVSAASELVLNGEGTFPLDPTLGNAHKIEATEETFLEHVKKGGAIMYPIFGMAGLAVLIALFKWISFLFVRKPSKKKVRALFAAVAENDEGLAKQRALAIRGPVGRMLQAGADHLEEPRDLIEEVMFERMLTTRMKLNGMLPFIAICAASAPLLGLLGTVTGIIDTFKMITVFGAGDPKALSGGISEALITTKFGLIVAIPSLLLHAFLSRKAKGQIGKMESTAVGFLNEVGKAANARRGPQLVERETRIEAAAPDEEAVRAQVNEILRDLLGPLSEDATNHELVRSSTTQPN